MSVKAVAYSAENVFWEGFSWDICLDPNKPVNEVIDALKKNQYITETDVRSLKARLKRYGKVVINVAGLLGDLIGGPWPGSSYSLEEHEEYAGRMRKRITGITQAFAKGVEMKTIKEIANATDLTKGIDKVVKELKERGVYQLASSIGISPFIHAVAKRMGGIDHVEAPETFVYVDGEKRLFKPEILEIDDAKIASCFKGPYDSSDVVRRAISKLNLEPFEILYVESAEPDTEMLKEIKSKGGNIIAFRPNNSILRRVYERNEIPMLYAVGEPNAESILEIAVDPKKNIGKYCV